MTNSFQCDSCKNHFADCFQKSKDRDRLNINVNNNQLVFDLCRECFEKRFGDMFTRTAKGFQKGGFD